VEGWHEQGFQRRVFAKLKAASQLLQQQQHCAENFHGTHLLRKGFAALRDSLQCRQGDLATAYQHYDQNAALRALTLLQTESRLAPLSRSLQRTINANVLRKALRIWNLNLDLARQASEVDRRRILQTAWTDWNDALRCKALVQKTNERLLVENLYRWVLHERFRLFRRTVDGRIQSQVLSWWRSKVEEERDRLADAEIVFAERQRRRRLSYGMLRLNIAMHSREDAERAAIELAMSRALPKALDAWKEQTDHARRLAKWAADARFYFLCSSALKTWKERTTEHVANRRRDAYLHIRARLKTRLAMGCFSRLRTASESVQSMRVQAEQSRRSWRISERQLSNIGESRVQDTKI
jgi:protein SFI1